MNLDKTHLVTGTLSALGTAFIGFMMFGSTYGELKSDVGGLKERTTKLEARMEKVDRPRVAKGDLCLKLLDDVDMRIVSPERLKDIEKQLEKLDCYEGVAANAMLPADEYGNSTNDTNSASSSQ